MKLTPKQQSERTQDTQWVDRVLTKVTEQGDWYTCCSDSTCWGLDRRYGVEPLVGDRTRLYGGLGRVTRGMDLNGTPVWYSTQAEREAKHAEWVEDLHTRYREEYAEVKDRLAEELVELPAPFRERIERTLREDPDWAWKGMGQRYEQFALVQAAKIHRHFQGDAEAISKWRKMDDYKEQKTMGPELDDGMSGNQFGFAGYMAEALALGIEV